MELHFGTFLKGPKRNDEVLCQIFLINGSRFMHQKRFSKN